MHASRPVRLVMYTNLIQIMQLSSFDLRYGEIVQVPGLQYSLSFSAQVSDAFLYMHMSGPKRLLMSQRACCPQASWERNHATVSTPALNVSVFWDSICGSWSAIMRVFTDSIRKSTRLVVIFALTSKFHPTIRNDCMVKSLSLLIPCCIV
jgi:hypothetical protein